jgi:hypothetical protein
MSGTGWFLDKAEQCARMAKEASDPRLRSMLEIESQLWLQIAEKSSKPGLLNTKPN